MQRAIFLSTISVIRHGRSLTIYVSPFYILAFAYTTLCHLALGSNISDRRWRCITLCLHAAFFCAFTATVSKMFDPPEGRAPYSWVFDLSGEFRHDRSDVVRFCRFPTFVSLLSFSRPLRNSNNENSWNFLHFSPWSLFGVRVDPNRANAEHCTIAWRGGCSAERQSIRPRNAVVLRDSRQRHPR